MSDYCIENDFAAQREMAEREGDTIAKLREEKAELEAQVLYWAESSVADLIKEVATRCAEIAYNYRGEALVGVHKSSEGIAVAIRKEYGLEP